MQAHFAALLAEFSTKKRTHGDAFEEARAALRVDRRAAMETGREADSYERAERRGVARQRGTFFERAPFPKALFDSTGPRLVANGAVNKPYANMVVIKGCSFVATLPVGTVIPIPSTTANVVSAGDASISLALTISQNGNASYSIGTNAKMPTTPQAQIDNLAKQFPDYDINSITVGCVAFTSSVGANDAVLWAATRDGAAITATMTSKPAEAQPIDLDVLVVKLGDKYLSLNGAGIRATTTDMNTASLIAAAFIPKINLNTTKLVVCDISSGNESAFDFTTTSSLIAICAKADLGAVEIKGVAKTEKTPADPSSTQTEAGAPPSKKGKK